MESNNNNDSSSTAGRVEEDPATGPPRFFSSKNSKWKARETQNPFGSTTSVNLRKNQQQPNNYNNLKAETTTPVKRRGNNNMPELTPLPASFFNKLNNNNNVSLNENQSSARGTITPREEEESFVESLKNLTPRKKIANPLLKSRITRESSSELLNNAAASPRPFLTPMMKPKRPSQGNYNQKASCVTALNEIKQKRENRRKAQATERERKNREKKRHGNDKSYVFRNLIESYRKRLNNAEDIDPETHQRMNNNNNRLNVYVRKRPLNSKELENKGFDIITCIRGNSTVVVHEPKQKVDLTQALDNTPFTFDGVFSTNHDNSYVYDVMVRPELPSLVENDDFTLTVFAYGQTGSGKTYTMQSVYRNVAAEIFTLLASSPDADDLRVGFSFYEIYMSKIFDLLHRREEHKVMEDEDGEVQIVGLREYDVPDAEALLSLITAGEEARVCNKNAIHQDSSRSHAIARITIYNNTERAARLSMVDLAGSERAGDCQTDDKQTRMEGAEINKSLLALKECIRALDDPNKARHIPFRGSKLTQILRESFVKQNSKTIMLATISPSSACSNDTLNTLRYADRLKEI